MRKLTKFASFALAATLVAGSLAACGGSSSSSEDSTGSESGATFNIGAIGPSTGDAGAYGTAVKNGAQIAVDEINEAGGINGYQISYSFEDDQNDVEKAQNAYAALKDKDMQVLLGTVTSKPCIAVSQLAYDDNIFTLTPSATAVEAIEPDNAFRVCFSDPSQGTVSAQYIADNKLATKIAVIYNSSDAYSSGIYKNFVAEAENQGLEIVAAEAFTDDSKTDFSVQLQKAKNAGAELLYMPFYYQEASLVLKQADAMNFKPIFFGVDGMDGILGVENFDTSLANDVLFLAPFCSTSTDETISAFVTKYEDQFGETPNQFAADAYDGVYIIKQALEAGDATPDMTTEEINELLKTQMTQITFAGVTSKEITWEADGEPQKAPQVIQIVDGVYTEVE